MRPTVRPSTAGDRRWAEGLLEEQMGSARVVRLGELLEPAGLPGLVAERDGERIGLLKPELPEINPDNRIPMRDLLELELPLAAPDAPETGAPGP